jgi:hypothetical protein
MTRDIGPSVDRERPPQVVGFEITPPPLTGGPRDFYCGIDAPPVVEWPIRLLPIWRGEVPEGACCQRCGLDLDAL